MRWYKMMKIYKKETSKFSVNLSSFTQIYNRVIPKANDIYWRRINLVFPDISSLTFVVQGLKYNVDWELVNWIVEHSHFVSGLKVFLIVWWYLFHNQSKSGSLEVQINFINLVEIKNIIAGRL